MPYSSCCRRKSVSEIQPLLADDKKACIKFCHCQISSSIKENLLNASRFGTVTYLWQLFSDEGARHHGLAFENVPGTCDNLCHCSGDCWGFSCLAAFGEFSAVFTINCGKHLFKRYCLNSTDEAALQALPRSHLLFLSEAALDSTIQSLPPLASAAVWAIVVQIMRDLTLKLAAWLGGGLTMIATGILCGLAFLCVLAALRLIINHPRFKPWFNRHHVHMDPLTREQFIEDLKFSFYKIGFSSAALVLSVYVPDYCSSPNTCLNSLQAAFLSVTGFAVGTVTEKYLAPGVQRVAVSCCSGCAAVYKKCTCAACLTALTTVTRQPGAQSGSGVEFKDPFELEIGQTHF
jgi:hypothetical protein